jgi:two-component system response regulator VicR
LEGYLNKGLSKAITVYNDPKILLLDDNRDLLQIVQIILKGHGYDTVLASSIEEASLKIRIHKPALILMDVFISDQDGREFCNKIKHDPTTNNIRVIMMSGIDGNLGLTTIGADDFMQKPFDYNDLIERVQTHMLYCRQSAVHVE